MAHTAAVLSQAADGWHADEPELDDAEDLDAVVDAVRDLAASHGAQRALLLVEEDDEYVAVLRVDGDAEPRVFLSDSRAPLSYRLAGLLAEGVEGDLPPLPGDDDEESLPPEAEPAGDTALLADLGTPAEQLLELCAEEGMLPADVVTAVCERAGCLPQLEELRP